MNAARRDTSISGLEPHRLRLDYIDLRHTARAVDRAHWITILDYYRGNYRGGGGGQTKNRSTHTTAENPNA